MPFKSQKGQQNKPAKLACQHVLLNVVSSVPTAPQLRHGVCLVMRPTPFPLAAPVEDDAQRRDRSSGTRPPRGAAAVEARTELHGPDRRARTDLARPITPATWRATTSAMTVAPITAAATERRSTRSKNLCQTNASKLGRRHTYGTQINYARGHKEHSEQRSGPVGCPGEAASSWCTLQAAG